MKILCFSLAVITDKMRDEYFRGAACDRLDIESDNIGRRITRLESVGCL